MDSSRRNQACRHRTAPGSRAFTLVELLVVITIIGIVSIVVIPQVINAMGNRKVIEAARILQAGLVGARDSAIHNNEACGIRLLPDPSLILPGPGQVNAGTTLLAYNRFVPLDPAPDYSEGRVQTHETWYDNINPYPGNQHLGWQDPNTNALPAGKLIVWQAVGNADPDVNAGSYGLPNAPTSWYWNIRVGDKFQFQNSGRVYTIIGPMYYGGAQSNPEGFVNIGRPGTPPTPDQYSAKKTNPEYLYLSNGYDDDQDGFIDEGWDGIDNNQNGIPDYIFEQGLLPINQEYENETWLDAAGWNTNGKNNQPVSVPYVITRRPMVTRGSRETALPGGVVIDATTWQNGSSSERSRLPIDPNTLYADVMLQPSGQVIPSTPYASLATYSPYLPSLGSAFFHFWITDREDVHEMSVQAANGVPYCLPMPKGTIGYPNANDTVFSTTYLTGERRLLTLFTRSGNIVTNEVEPAMQTTNPFKPAATIFTSGFLGSFVGNTYLDAQIGVRSAQ